MVTLRRSEALRLSESQARIKWQFKMQEHEHQMQNSEVMEALKRDAQSCQKTSQGPGKKESRTQTQHL